MTGRLLKLYRRLSPLRETSTGILTPCDCPSAVPLKTSVARYSLGSLASMVAASAAGDVFEFVAAAFVLPALLFVSTVTLPCWQPTASASTSAAVAARNV